MTPDSGKSRRPARVTFSGQVGRLDKVLVLEVPSISRREARRLIEAGAVFVDGRRCRVASRQLSSRARVVVHTAFPPNAATPTEEPSIPVLFEDESVIVVDKPAGVHVHMTETSPDASLVERLPAPVFPVHRLDRGTSGVVVLAKDPKTAALLVEIFRARKAKKRYVAVVDGQVADGLIDDPIGRDPRRPRLFRVEAGGRSARTLVRTCAVADRLSVLAIDLLTGRTHQIRVHLASRGAPIVGDKVYGGRAHVRIHDRVVEVPRPALHAAWITLPLPGGTRTFRAPLPSDLFGLVEAGLALDAAYA